MHSMTGNVNQAPAPILAFKQLPQEVVCFKQVAHGRPVFWIHAAAGGNSIWQYQRIANVSERTLYAIKPPSIDITHYWLSGIEARASYYVALITSIDPDGPYDLGGYSMGSTLAYEVTRQLVLMGHKVQSLVLIDPTDMSSVQAWTAAHNNSDLGAQSLVLRTMNFSLLHDDSTQGKTARGSLIHRDDVSGYTNLDAFIERIYDLGVQRGLRLAKDQFMLRVIQDHQLLESLVCNGYNRSLPEHCEVQVYLFVNRSRAMQGTAAPYILMSDYLSRGIEENYNAEWLVKCRRFKITELECTTHFMLLFEAESLKPCVELCRKLYQLGPVSPVR